MAVLNEVQNIKENIKLEDMLEQLYNSIKQGQENIKVELDKSTTLLNALNDKEKPTVAEFVKELEDRVELLNKQQGTILEHEVILNDIKKACEDITVANVVAKVFKILIR